jgi:large subunit ribosomal protein L32
MAVPKKKTSQARRGLRRGGNGTYKVDLPNVMIDKDTGEYKLSHHISLDGYYNGRKVLKGKPVKEVAEENKEEALS